METGISCIMYFHGYRSYQKKRLKNKYGKYLMGMLVVTALVTFFVQRQELWSIGKKAAVKMAGTAVVDEIGRASCRERV